MRLEQKKGPFSANSSFTVGGTDAREYVHIGIQIPNRQPIEYLTTSITPDVRVSMDNSSINTDYRINETGILEFDCEMGTKAQVTFLKAMPTETIVDLVYIPEGE